LKRKQILSNIDTQTTSSTAEQCLVTVAGNVAVTNICLDSVVSQDVTAVAFTTIFKTSKREALVSAGSQATGGGHLRTINIHGPCQSATL